MSNLQVLARRCPVMGKALTVQSARNGNNALNGGGTRAYTSGKAKLHTSRPNKASVEPEVIRRGNNGTIYLFSTFNGN